jgi:hypothetical protein
MEREFATYRRELPRLLAEGHAGRYALIKEDQVISVWDTVGDANQAGHIQFGLDVPFAVNKVNPLDVRRFELWDAQKARGCAS